MVAEQLIAISRTPLSRQRTPLGQPIPASTPSRQLVRDSDDGISLNDHDERSPSTARTGRPDSASKARILPSSLSAPTIQPRLSKAAALRMGIKLPDKRSTERREEVDNNGTAVAEEQREKVFVPGTVRRAVTPPKSLAKPSVAPRQNRASALRTTDGVELRGAAVRPPTSRRESVGTSERSSPFIGLPGFAKQKKSQNASSSRNEQVSRFHLSFFWKMKLRRIGELHSIQHPVRTELPCCAKVPPRVISPRSHSQLSRAKR